MSSASTRGPYRPRGGLLACDLAVKRLSPALPPPGCGVARATTLMRCSAESNGWRCTTCSCHVAVLQARGTGVSREERLMMRCPEGWWKATHLLFAFACLAPALACSGSCVAVDVVLL